MPHLHDRYSLGSLFGSAPVQKAFLVLGLLLLSGYAGEDLNTLAEDACRESRKHALAERPHLQRVR